VDIVLSHGGFSSGLWVRLHNNGALRAVYTRDTCGQYDDESRVASQLLTKTNRSGNDLQQNCDCDCHQ
jgi:hypothetical protein